MIGARVHLTKHAYDRLRERADAPLSLAAAEAIVRHVVAENTARAHNDVGQLRLDFVFQGSPWRLVLEPLHAHRYAVVTAYRTDVRDWQALDSVTAYRNDLP